MIKEKKSLGIYVHIPFCEKKCAYCDFLSAPPKDEQQIRHYTQALCRDLYASSKALEDYVVDTLYIGGGTPSLLSVEDMTQIHAAINQNYRLAKQYEWTVECNPNSVTKEKLWAYRQLGINRISMGFQAKQDALLKTLGRLHSFSQYEQAYQWVRECGFKNVNVDVMYGLPGQTFSQWKETLSYICSLDLAHISAYSLILEENTPFYEKYGLGFSDELPNEDVVMQMEDYLLEQMQRSGYQRYEISNFSKLHYESKHNLRYWQLKDYLGVGLGASSFFGGNPGYRMKRTDNCKQYLCGDFGIRLQEETVESQMEEFCFLGLRMMKEGINKKRFEAMFGEEFSDIYSDCLLKKWLDGGYLEEYQNPPDTTGIRLTKRGAEVANQIMADFLFLPAPSSENQSP